MSKKELRPEEIEKRKKINKKLLPIIGILFILGVIVNVLFSTSGICQYRSHKIFDISAIFFRDYPAALLRYENISDSQICFFLPHLSGYFCRISFIRLFLLAMIISAVPL